MGILAILATFPIVWIGFAAFGLSKGSRGMVSIGLGFLVACITVSALALVLLGEPGHVWLVFLAAVVLTPTLLIRSARIRRRATEAQPSHGPGGEKGNETVEREETSVLVEALRRSPVPLVVSAFWLTVVAVNVMYITWVRS